MADRDSLKSDCVNRPSDHEEKMTYVQPECGIGSVKPKVLRKSANMAMFTGVYSVCGLLTSSLSTYVNSQVTTLERQFGFSSTQTGVMMAANDVGYLAVVLFVSHMANKVHIPRALALMTMLFGISALICSLPQFLFGAPAPTDLRFSNVSKTTVKPGARFSGQICDGIFEEPLACDATLNASGPARLTDKGSWQSAADGNTLAAFVIIMMGMVLQGFAKAPRTSFVTSFIDNNVPKTKTGLYLGTVFAIAVLGPTIAFALGGVFSRIYVTLEETNMHYRHPNWLGAWWLGYVTFGSAACVFAIPLLCFPKSIKGDKHSKKQAIVAQRKLTFFKMVAAFLKDFSLTWMRLLRNPVYMFAILSSCALLFSVAASRAFLPKYIENQFSFPTWKANMAMAALMLSTAFLGTFLGGYLSKRFKMGPMASLYFSTAMQVLALVFNGLAMAFGCAQPYLHNSPELRAASADSQNASCYDNCACNDDDYFPVCGDDGRTFFSPCHAGCLQHQGTNYINCTCIAGGKAVPGMCDYSCAMFIPFMICICCTSLFGTLSVVPKFIIYIRSVEERDKPLALGFYSFMSSITGWMLAPIYIGHLIDGICVLWEKKCTGRGACRLYDNDNFRFKLFGYLTAFWFLGLVLVVAALIVAKVKKTFEIVEEEVAAAEISASPMIVNKENDKGDNWNNHQ